MKKIELLDTSLRDGVQSLDINFSLQDKLDAIECLTNLGIHLIEAGMPESNPLDRELFAAVKDDRIAAFCSTAINADGSSASDIIDVKNVVIYGKAIASQVSGILGISPELYLDKIADSLRAYSGKRIIFDAEHFFDGYLEDSAYALKVLETAAASGADTLTLCDTNGANLPDTVRRITELVKNHFPGIVIGIHAHDDMGLAAANSLAAIEGGAAHLQGTLLGYGERCGNACLSTLIPTLQLKLGYDIIGERIKSLTAACRAIADITNIPLSPNLPYVGKNAFAHKAGTHIDAVIKDNGSYQHIEPEAVGNRSATTVSLLTGKANILNKTGGKLDNEAAQKIVNGVKEAESLGYSFDGAEASFAIFVKKTLGEYKPFFDLIDYRVISDDTGNNAAMVKVSAGGEIKLACGEGLGPVHALDTALRNALLSVYPAISSVSLIDYKVRVLSAVSATASMVRVLITSSDESETWSNIGVSADIIEASYNALAESINYYLMKRSGL